MGNKTDKPSNTILGSSLHLHATNLGWNFQKLGLKTLNQELCLQVWHSV